jgi:signal transduction histidine kinase
MIEVVALYVACTGTTTVLAAVLAAVAWRRRDVPGGSAFAAFAAAIALWTFGATMELLAGEFGAALTWNRVAYVGGVLVPPTWVTFTLAYTGRRRLLGPATYAALAVEPVVLTALLFTVEPGGPIWLDAAPARTGGVVLADVVYGPLFWVHLAYSYVLVGGGLAVLVRTMVEAPQRHAVQLLALAVAPVAPFLVNAVSVAEAAPLPAADISAAGLAVGAVPIYLALLRRQFLDVVPLARQRVLETLPQGVVVLDAADRVAEANPAAERVLGRPVAEGMPATALLPEDVELPTGDLVDRGPRGGTGADGDGGADGTDGDGRTTPADVLTQGDRTVTLRGPDGPRHVAVAVTPVESDGHRAGRVVQLTDVTAERERRELLTAQREQLAVLNRVVRHDVRNDMNVLLGWASLAREEAPPALHDELDRVLQAGRDVVDLTAALRDLEAVTVDDAASDRRTVDLAAVLRSEAEKVRSATSASVDLDPALEEGPVPVRANELLRSVFKNLLDNAATHGGHESPTVTVTVTDRGGTVLVDVADDGRGVPDDRKETVFGRGEKGLDSPGSGLGLYLADAIVTGFGGRVWIEDNEPRGARFRVELPRADGADDDRAAAGDRASGGGPRESDRANGAPE